MIVGISYNPYIEVKKISQAQNFDKQSSAAPGKDYPQYNEISREASNALKAYISAQTTPKKDFQLYKTNEIPQEIYTNDGINFNTTPDDYIKYLRAAGKNFSVEHIKEKDGREIVQICERGKNSIKYTSWDYDDVKSGKHSAIIRDISDLRTNRLNKRTVFYEDATEIYPRIK